MVLISAFVATVLFGQTPPKFEVAEIRHSTTQSAPHAMDFTRAGQFTARNVTLSEFLPLVFQTRRESVERLPKWFETTRFDIVAKSPPQTSERELGLLLRALFVREFKMVWHIETKPQDGYALVITRNGSRLSPSTKPGPPLCTRGLDSLDCTNFTSTLLAERLSLLAPTEIDRTIVDETGLTGAFDFKLEWVAARRAEAEGGLSLFDALTKQLGLRLESRKLPLPAVAIDRAEPLSVN